MKFVESLIRREIEIFATTRDRFLVKKEEKFYRKISEIYFGIEKINEVRKYQANIKI